MKGDCITYLCVNYNPRDSLTVFKSTSNHSRSDKEYVFKTTDVMSLVDMNKEADNHLIELDLAKDP